MPCSSENHVTSLQSKHGKTGIPDQYQVQLVSLVQCREQEEPSLNNNSLELVNLTPLSLLYENEKTGY